MGLHQCEHHLAVFLGWPAAGFYGDHENHVKISRKYVKIMFMMKINKIIVTVNRPWCPHIIENHRLRRQTRSIWVPNVKYCKIMASGSQLASFPSFSYTVLNHLHEHLHTPGTPTNVINMAFGSQRVATNGPLNHSAWGQTSSSRLHCTTEIWSH